jgi:hypothetical protein
MRDDISYIDGASAVLSLGGGRAFSVRSSAISKYSIATAATTLSVASSKFMNSSRHSSTINGSRPGGKVPMTERKLKAKSIFNNARNVLN